MLQTVALIKLNFQRQIVKSKIKWILFILVIFTLLPFILLQRFGQEYNQDQQPTEIISLPVFYDDSAFTSNSIKEAIKTLNFTLLKKQEYLKDTTSTPLVFFQSEKSYTIFTHGSQSVVEIEKCVGQCDIDKDALTIARLKFNLDTALNKLLPPVVLKVLNVTNKGTRLKFLSDFFFWALGFLLINSLLEDKKKGIKFGLFMTGIKRSSYYIGLLFWPIFIATLYSLLCIIMSIISFETSSTTGPTIILNLTAAYGYIFFFWVITHYTSNTNTASVILFLYIAIAYVPSSADSISEFFIFQCPFYVPLLLCINPSFGLSSYIYMIKRFPMVNGFSNVSVPSNAPSGMMILIIVNQVIFASVFWTMFMIVLAIYLDSLHKSEDQVLSFFYPIQKLFAKSSTTLQEFKTYNSNIEESNIDSIPSDQKIVIENVSKQYHGTTQPALTNVNIQLKKGEIVGLLGYNGAGKSTLINILCGVSSPSQGKISVFGMDCNTHRFDISKKMGICSQKDILFDVLTAREHLYYFGLMRGVNAKDINDVISTTILELKMQDMIDTPSSIISGGQKRKLCVALAFINNPELVVLDEMSSGVDPENRRVIWDFLSRKKQNRAILLCTHFMDEADILTDRKAMLTLGELVCLGSSKYLKDVYDTGYTWTIEKSSVFDQTVVDNWLLQRQIQPIIKRNNNDIIEYQISAKKLSFLKDWEVDPQMTRLQKAFSVKENGLEQIFSNPSLVNEEDLHVNPNDQKRILDLMELFQDPSWFTKVWYLMRFELQRFLSNIPTYLPRLMFMICYTSIICYNLKTGLEYEVKVKEEKLDLDLKLIDKLFPSSIVMETNIQKLLLEDPNRYVPVGEIGSRFSAGSILFNGTHNVITTIYGILGPLLDIESRIYGQGITTSVETMTSENSNPISNQLLVWVLLLLLMFEIAIFVAEEVVVSKEKIKFLLLSAGTPLTGYWFITISKLLIATGIFPLAIIICGSEFLDRFSVYVVGLYMMVISFGAFIGTLFDRNAGKAVHSAVLFGGIMSFAIILILSGILRWDISTEFSKISNVYAWSPVSPLRFLIDPFSSIDTPILSSFIYFVILTLGVVAWELQHMFVKKVTSASETCSKDQFKMQRQEIIENSKGISFENVSRKFGIWKPKTAVSNVNMSVDQNEMFALIGPNGCGKTTTLNMLTAQLLPSTGSIHVNNVHVASNRLKIIKSIGYCPQFDDLLIPSMSVYEHLNLFCSVNGMKQEYADEYVDLLLNAFGIATFKFYKAGSLSGGTKRKVSAAIAVLLKRCIVVLDEASTGLDPLARQKLWNTVKLLNKNRTTIMTTHYINETVICDRIAIMNQSKLICCDTEHNLTKQFAKGYAVNLYFNGPCITEEFICKNVFFDDPLPKIKVENRIGSTVLVQFIEFKPPLGVLLNRLLTLKTNGLLREFSIERKNLENIFLEIIRQN